MIPKNPRQEDLRYLDFIRSQRCLCEGRKCIGRITPHHIISRGAWGSDCRSIPLCLYHHMETEQRGLAYMEKTYNFNALDEIIKLLSEYLKEKNDGYEKDKR